MATGSDTALIFGTKLSNNSKQKRKLITFWVDTILRCFETDCRKMKRREIIVYSNQNFQLLIKIETMVGCSVLFTFCVL